MRTPIFEQVAADLDIRPKLPEPPRYDMRPCRYRFPRGHLCGRPEFDLPSHGESFVAHYYVPERRSGDRRKA